MAVGQQKRAAGVVKYNLQEQCGGKKKKIVDGNALNMRPHISLEWDDCQKKVMAKREQIGISWRDISPSIDSAHQFKTGLADVFPVPEEIFRLENLMSVLTYKEWKTHLSESERSLPSQFLPRGTDDVGQVVQALLMGENLHIGNPSFSWGASLCSGNLHPDVLIHWDRRVKARKKAYYSGLQKYHFDMVDNLQKWKSRLACCNNLEGEIVGKMCRKYKLGSSTIASEATEEVANSGQEMLDKPYICFGNAAKYGTYSKTTKKQDQQVTRMTLCHDDTQSKSPNPVTINVQSIHVQPCKEFEEETKKLHDHRLQLESRDIPVAFANHSKGQLQKELSMKCLEKELEEEKELLTDEYFAARNVWEEARTSDSYCHRTTASHGCAYTDELSLRQPQSVKEQQAPLINLESDAIELEAGESLPQHASSNEAMPLLHTDHGTSSFYSYTDQAHCGLLLPSIKDQEMSQYYPQENTNGLKQPGLLFLEENNILPENGQLHQQFEEQQRHLFQIRDRELYMRQLMHENIYSSSIYGRKELQTAAANVQGWAADSAHAAAPIQSPLGSSRLLNHDWLPGSRGQCLEYKANTDERLFSIFPNELHSLPPRTSMNPEQYSPAKSFISSGGIGSLHQLNYLNASETPPAAMKVDNNPFMWMNTPNPNPGPHDAYGKPSVRQWNYWCNLRQEGHHIHAWAPCRRFCFMVHINDLCALVGGGDPVCLRGCGIQSVKAYIIQKSIPRPEVYIYYV